MSLTAALNNALTSIQTLNTAVSVVSDNIANATNETYNTRNAVFQTLTYGGVELSSVQRLSNEGLLRDLLRQISAVGSDAVQDRYYSRLEELAGTIDGNTPLVDYVESFRTAWKGFEAAPESQAAQREVVIAADQMAREIKRLATGIEEINTEINREITNTISTLNTSLQEVNRLNGLIRRELSSGRETANLQNLRDTEIAKIAEIMDVRVISNGDGSVSVYSSTGYDLVASNASTFSYNAATQTLSKTGVTGAVAIGDGKLKALLDFVDTSPDAVDSSDPNVGVLEKYRNQLDEFVRMWTDNSTAAMRGTGNLLDTGVYTAGTTITLSENGGAAVTVTLGALPALNPPTITTYREQVETAIATAIAGAAPATTTLSGRLTADGRLELATTAGSLAITGGTALASTGLSVSTMQTRDPPTFARAYEDATLYNAGELDGGATERFFTVESGTYPDELGRFNFQINPSLKNGTQSLKRLSGTAVVEALNAEARTYSVAGLTVPNQDYSGIAAGILTDVTRRASLATSSVDQSSSIRDNLYSTYRNDVGVSIDEETAKLITLQNNYAASARVIDVTQTLFDLLERVV